MPIFKKTLIILSFIFLISILIYLNMYLFGTSTVGIYGVILITYLVIKLGLSFLYEPFKGKPHDYKVAAVIPSYNEDAESLLETLKSVLAQTYPLSEIYIVDDGSSNTDAIQLIEEYVNREVIFVETLSFTVPLSIKENAMLKRGHLKDLTLTFF